MILVTGGTGFVGQVLIKQLVQNGWPVRILLRPSASSPNIPRGVPVEVAVCSMQDQRSLKASLKDVDVIFHLAGSERSGSRSDLTGVDVEGTEALSQAAAQTSVERVFFLSHLGADRFSAYPVLKAKALAEGYIIRSGVAYSIFRSAPIFGPGDQFTTSFANVLKGSPGIFLLPGDGSSLIQPIWIEDLVMSMVLALEDSRMKNQIFELGGSEYFTFRSVIEMIMAATSTRRLFVSMNPAYLRILALYIENAYKKFPLSLFWLDYLASDRTCALDSLPRNFSLMPARFNQQLDYLKPKSSQFPRSKK
jgi:nucleoside-diphosphate-sugar epimerase